MLTPTAKNLKSAPIKTPIAPTNKNPGSEKKSPFTNAKNPSTKGEKVHTGMILPNNHINTGSTMSPKTAATITTTADQTRIATLGTHLTKAMRSRIMKQNLSTIGKREVLKAPSTKTPSTNNPGNTSANRVVALS